MTFTFVKIIEFYMAKLFRAVVQLLITVPAMACAKANPLGPKGQRLLVYLQG